MIEKLDKNQIIELLPHREPMLLIDELTNIKKLFLLATFANFKSLSILKGPLFLKKGLFINKSFYQNFHRILIKIYC